MPTGITEQQSLDQQKQDNLCTCTVLYCTCICQLKQHVFSFGTVGIEYNKYVYVSIRVDTKFRKIRIKIP
jgi:hypothetical protein